MKKFNFIQIRAIELQHFNLYNNFKVQQVPIFSAKSQIVDIKLLGGESMHNYSKIAGILSIVSGGFSALIGLFYPLLAVLMTAGMSSIPEINSSSDFPRIFFGIMIAIYSFIGLYFGLLGALAIVGGIFSIKRRRWGWALAGAIAASMSFTYLGIPAIVLVSLGRNEFSSSSNSSTSS
jgi:hypothetical protein